MIKRLDWKIIYSDFQQKCYGTLLDTVRVAKKLLRYLRQLPIKGELKILGESVEIKMPSGKTRYGYPTSCMCDIPFKDLRIHTMRYGKFGIAFKKNSAIENGHFNPVLYVHYNLPLFEDAEKILDELDNSNEINDELKEKMTNYFNLIGAYVKRGDLTKNVESKNLELDEQQLNNFYYEREWRSVCPWNFKKSDVVAVMVKDEKHRESFRNYIATKKLDIFENITILSHDLIDNL